MNVSDRERYEMLVESIQLIAAPYETQKSILPEFVCIQDELSTTYGDHAYLLVPELARLGFLDERTVKKLDALDDHFAAQVEDIIYKRKTQNNLSAEEDFAEISLEAHPFWVEARRLACEILDLMNEEKGIQRLSYVTYVM